MEFDGTPHAGNQTFIGEIRDSFRHFTDGATRRLNDLCVTEQPVLIPPSQTDLDFAEKLFDNVWSRFFEDFDIDFAGAMEQSARVFGSHRGVVIASNGYGVGPDIGHPGTVRSNRFGEPPQQVPGSQYSPPPCTDALGREWATEPLAVTKAHWNIISCLGEVPDQREFVASSMFKRRALFISPLGSVIQRSDAAGRSILPDNHNRFLIITCGQPNRESCGRLVEPLMSITAAKAMALRDWAIVSDSSEQAIVRGQQLDVVVDHWAKKKTKL